MGSYRDAVYQEEFDRLIKLLVAQGLVAISQNQPPRLDRHASGMAAVIAVDEFIKTCHSEVISHWHHTRDIVAEYGIHGAVVEFVRLMVGRDDMRGEEACWEQLYGTASCGLATRLGLSEAATLVALELWRRDEKANGNS